MNYYEEIIDKKKLFKKIKYSIEKEQIDGDFLNIQFMIDNHFLAPDHPKYNYYKDKKWRLHWWGSSLACHENYDNEPTEVDIDKFVGRVMEWLEIRVARGNEPYNEDEEFYLPIKTDLSCWEDDMHSDSSYGPLQFMINKECRHVTFICNKCKENFTFHGEFFLQFVFNSYKYRKKYRKLYDGSVGMKAFLEHLEEQHSDCNVPIENEMNKFFAGKDVRIHLGKGVDND